MDQTIRLGVDILNNKIANNYYNFKDASYCLKKNLRERREISEADFIKISFEIFNEFIKGDFLICNNCGKKVEL